MTIVEAQDIIKRSLPEEEILLQLAEEAAELAQAALKLRRAIMALILRRSLRKRRGRIL